MTWSTDPEALFGFPSGSFGDELRIWSLLHPDDKAVMDEAMAFALKTGVYQAEYRAVRPGGSVVWLTGRGVWCPMDGRTGWSESHATSHSSGKPCWSARTCYARRARRATRRRRRACTTLRKSRKQPDVRVRAPENQRQPIRVHGVVPFDVWIRARAELVPLN